MNSLHDDDALVSQSFDDHDSIKGKAPLEVILKLENTKFPSLLVQTPGKPKYFTLKIFPLRSGQVSHPFKNETRFFRLSHPNLVSYASYNDDTKFKFEKEEIVGSFILMDGSLYGSLAELIKLTDLFQDETLLRTYFHQLIDGLDYLHKNGISHMNLKLSNLLIGNDFRLKIANLEEGFIENREDLANSMN